MTRFLKIIAPLLGSAALASAYTNILENGTNQPVTVDWDIGGQEIVVGGSTSGNKLDIYNGSIVTNVMQGTIGRDASANNNIVIVEDAAWFNSGDLYVGDAGSGNTMYVTNNALVENADAWVGAQSGANSNSVFISDNSTWDNQGVLNMANGLSNAVTVSDGGAVVADSLLINSNNNFNLNDNGTLHLHSSFDVSTNGFNWNEGGHFSMTNGTLTGLTETNGAAILTGGRDLTLDDSILDVSGSDLAVGYEGSGSALVIVNGAVVTNENGTIGYGSNSSNNVVLVSGEGSVWKNKGNSLDVGVGAGTRNRLIVDDGGWAFVGDVTEADIVGATTNGGVVVASTAGATLVAENSATVEIGGGLFVGATNGMEGTVTIQNNSLVKAGTLTIENGSSLNLKETGSLAVEGDFLYGNDSAKFVWENNSSLSVGGTLSKTNGLDGTQRNLTLDGGNWSLPDANVLTGTSNQLNVISGGFLATTNGIVSGANNIAVVQGAGSHWQNNGALNITGVTNSVSVESGGKVSAGSVDVDDGNTFDINSDGTLAISTDFDWSTTENVNWNNGGTLLVENSNFTGMTSTNLSYNNSTNNGVTFVGGGRDLALNKADWSDIGNQDLMVGYTTSGASLAITNGSTVFNQDGYIGWGSSAAENSVLVSGTNSVWSNTDGDLYVGAYWSGTNLTKAGSKNTLDIRLGGQVFVGEATTNAPGMLVASTNGAQLTVWGGTVTIADTLYLGLDSNTTGRATIKQGATLTVGDLLLDANTNSVLELQDGGVFGIGTDFDQAAYEENGFIWGTNGTLSVGGDFTSTTNTLSKGRDLILDGPNATWGNISNQTLHVGIDYDSSILRVINGATLENMDTFIGASSNSGSHGVSIESGSSWITDGDLYIGAYSDKNYLEILEGSTNTLSGSAYIGAADTADNYAKVSGSNSLWTVGGNLDVGSSAGGVDNKLLVYDQALVSVSSNLTVHSGNKIAMNLDGLINIGGDLIIASNAVVSGSGTIALTSSTGALRLRNGNENIFASDYDIVFEGTGSNLMSVDGGIFYLAGSNSNLYRGFQTLELEDALLLGYGNNDAFQVVRMTNSTIRPSAELSRDRVGTLVINGDFSASNTTYAAQVLGKSGSDLLHIAGSTPVDLDGLIAAVGVAQITSNSITILTSDAGFGVTDFAETNIVNNLLLYDAGLEVSGNDVNVVITTNNTKFSSSLDYAGTEAVSAGFDSMKNSVFTRTKQLRRNLVSTAHAIPHEAFLMTNTNAPAGAQGPGRDNTIFDMHVWMQFFNGQGIYDEQGNSYGFDLDSGGTTIGADRLFGENLILGFNYTYALGNVRTSNHDSLDTETYWLGAYGEWISENGLFVDSLVALGWSNFDSVRVERDIAGRDYSGTASYKGNEMGGYVDVGQYYYYKNLALAPYAGLHALTIRTDDHEELNQNGLSSITVNGQSRTIFESALGVKGRFRFDTNIGRFQTTGYAEWTHDYIQEDIYSTLSANGLPAADMARIQPEADMLNAGLGLSWICTDYMEIGIGYNGRFSKNYGENSGSLMLDIMF